MNQLAPVWSTPTSPDQAEAVNNQILAQLRGQLVAANQDTQRLLAMEHAPFKGDVAAEKVLRERLKEWLVRNDVRNDPRVAAAIRRVHERVNGEEGAVAT